MKINHMICPNCGHDFYTDAMYATCDACNCFFYAAVSKTSRLPGGTIVLTPDRSTVPGTKWEEALKWTT